MDKVKNVLRSEPVRVWVYPLVFAALGIAFKEGYLDADTLGLIELALYAVLGVAGVETARARVTPVVPGSHELLNQALGWQTAGAHAQTEPLPRVEYRGH